MKLHPARIDFVPSGTVCQRCRRSIEEARVVIDQDGTELFYGPDCVNLVLTDEGKEMLGKIPDLTRRSRASAKSIVTHGKCGNAQGNEEDYGARHAAEYLWIRIGKIAAFCPTKSSLKYQPLVLAFDKLKENGYLLDSDVQHVLNIERKAPHKLKLTNLLDVYTANTQLQKKIDAKYNRALVWAQQQLHENLSLSQEQIKNTGLKLSKTAFVFNINT